jgi:hypothetical protein
MHTYNMGTYELFSAADRAFWLGDFPTALRLGTLSVDRFGEAKDYGGMMRALHFRSHLQRELFCFQNGITFVREAAKDASMGLLLVEKHRLGSFEGLSHFQMGEVELCLRNYEEAIFYFERALVSFHEAGMDVLKGHYAFRLGEALFRGGYRRRGYARGLLEQGLARLYSEVIVSPFVFALLFLVEDEISWAEFLLQEGKIEEAREAVALAERIAVTHSDLPVLQKKFAFLEERLGF